MTFLHIYLYFSLWRWQHLAATGLLSAKWTKGGLMLKPASHKSFNYAEYKFSSENNDSMASIHRTIDAAKEAGYTCGNNNAPVIFSFKEIQKRAQKAHRRSPNLADYSQASKSNCVILPTGEVFLIIGDGNVRYYIVLKADTQKVGGYHILDINR